MEQIIPKFYSYHKELLATIHKILNVKSFALYGGAAADLIIDPNASVNDYDIAIENMSSETIGGVKKQLVEAGYEITAERSYCIYNDIPVSLIYANNQDWSFDIGFLDDVSIVGQFNLESLYWRFPELDCVDKFEAIQGVLDKDLHLIRSIENENPFMLVSRYIRLAAKYNIPISKDIIRSLIIRIERWKAPNKFHGIEAQAALVSSIFKSIFMSVDRVLFIDSLAKTGLLNSVFPEIEHLATNISLLSIENKNRIMNASSKNELIKN